MIKYSLKCHNKHEFVSWFSDSEEFENLKKKKLLECIYCSSKVISKSIMAPMIYSSKYEDNNDFNFQKKLKNEKESLIKIRKYIENNFEFVGKNFSQKVRDIYYDKSSKKTIYGTASPEEREELADEGIDLVSIPWVEKEN